ncbi:hypothetical protein AO738_00525 [Pseudomonas citronellolis]|nr:hypothetical protein AO742_22445 [Pseudomonas citronellolis]KRW76737.1 hypothetical protein AO738_00525 [Pseudomonas citronellolis]
MRKATQHSTHRASIEMGEFQRERDQLVIAGQYFVEQQTFENCHAVASDGAMRIETFAVLRIE